jgi:hypothetical protein
MAASAGTLRVVVETGAKKVFASALGYPGWSRSGRTEHDAIAALIEYRDRFAPIAVRAGISVPARVTVEVVEHVTGNATTDFGAPGIPAAAESDPGSATDRRRAAALVQAAWEYFDEVVGAAPRVLRKGPRGGGRDTDAIRVHVFEAEQAYKGKLGIRGVTDPVAVREAMIAAITAGRAPERPNDWPTAYAARRIAWHAIDHAWEIEDRSS